CSSGKPKPEHFLALHLHHLFLCASKRCIEQEVAYVPLALGSGSAREARWHPGLPETRAREQLQTLLTDLTAGFQPYLYPFPLVETVLAPENQALTMEQWETRVRSLYEATGNARPWFADQPLRTPTEYPVLPLATAREQRQRWFAEFFRAVRRSA
ncbi:MAG TPA: hypothetical protein PKO06_19350, partial [Candidatus Ozemobacteraceae bacterium]|nr:hypothetical protein [Candidatus Ozemobacteraceae bacterium]